MKKVSLFLICLILTFLPCNAKTISEQEKPKDTPKVFIYHIPDNEEMAKQDDTNTSSQNIDSQAENITDIISDDITADTSGNPEPEEVFEDEEIKPIYISEEYQIDDMYSDVLHGYAVYDDEEENAISLEDHLEEYQAIKLRKPACVKGDKYYNAKTLTPNTYSKLTNMEYSITPVSSTNFRSKGGFSAGTTFSQGIDYSELEASTGVFSRYDSKYFAISTAYAKTVNSTNNNYNDNFYFSPELKINQYFTLKEILSADIAKNRKKAEFVISVNPFGKKDTDRMRFELGASSIFDQTNALMKNQFKFSTNFKL